MFNQKRQQVSDRIAFGSRSEGPPEIYYPKPKSASLHSTKNSNLLTINHSAFFSYVNNVLVQPQFGNNFCRMK